MIFKVCINLEYQHKASMHIKLDKHSHECHFYTHAVLFTQPACNVNILYLNVEHNLSCKTAYRAVNVYDSSGTLERLLFLS